MEEEVTLLSFYVSQNYIGYNAPIYKEGHTIETYLKLIAMTEVVKKRLVASVEKLLEDT